MYFSNRGSRLSVIIPTIAVLAILLGVATVGAQEVPRIDNGDSPTKGTTTLELEEVWTAGGADDDEVIFGVVNRVALDKDNNIYLLDTQLSEIKVFSPEGELINTLGREGDGPGEFRQPTDFCFLDDKTLGILQGFPGRVIKLGTDNSPQGTWELGDPTSGGFYIMQRLQQANGVVVGGGTAQVVDQAAGEIRRENFLSRLSVEGKRDVDYYTNMRMLDLQNIELHEIEVVDNPARRFDLTSDGKVVIGVPRNEYEIAVFNADGTPSHVITRKYTSWQRDARSLDIWKRIMETVRDNQVPGAVISYEKTEPDIAMLHTTPEGEIWVLNSRAMMEPADGLFTTYDVFNSDGIFEKQVNVICDGSAQEDLLIFADNNLVFKVSGFFSAALSRFGGSGNEEDGEEPEPMAVTCYKIS